MSRRIRIALALPLGLALFIGWNLALPHANGAAACEAEPASEWAPAGWICPPIYGTGTASTWDGPGVARNDCTWPWTDCQAIAITSLDTGIRVIVTPRMWCMCWVGVTGPNGESERIVDLDPETSRALGIGWPGLFRVSVQPFETDSLGPVLPDTATTR